MWQTVASLRDFDDTTPLGASVAGVSLVLVKAGDTYKAYQGTCPHEQAPLAEGRIEKGELICPLHGWRFGIQNGTSPRGPEACLRAFPTQVVGDAVQVDAQAVADYAQQQAAKHSTDARTIQDLPSPKKRPLVGHLGSFSLPQAHRDFGRWATELGPIFRLKLGPAGEFVVSGDPDLNQAILKDRPEGMRRVDRMEGIFKELHLNGVFSAEGEDWRRQRRHTAKGLNAAHLRNFYPTIRKVTERLHRRWATAQGEALDIQQELMRFTVDVTTNLTFGYDMNTLEKEGDVIQDQLSVIFPALFRRLNAPLPYWRYLKTKGDRELERTLQEVLKTIQTFIDAARDRMARQPELHENPTNLLEGMLAETEDGLRVTDEELQANVMTILLAGEDTTANTLAWATYYLAQHPAVQQKAQAEVDAVLGDSALVEFQDLVKLPYLEGIAQETLRMKPVAPLLYIQAIEDREVAGLAIPKGTKMILLTHHGGEQAEHFAEPTAFRPERWLAQGWNHAHRPDAMQPFGGGPRYCPGKNLAVVEMKVVLAMLIKHFEVGLASAEQDIKEVLAFTMGPTGLRVRLTARTAETVRG